MKAYRYRGALHFSRRPPREEAGAALVITLACIVILTARILVFLARSLLETQVSVASGDQTAAALFARGAVDSVIGELKQEITAGSVATFPPGSSDIRDPNCIFLPSTNQAMVPYRMDPGAPANVIKRSASGVPFYSGSFYSASWPAALLGGQPFDHEFGCDRTRHFPGPMESTAAHAPQSPTSTSLTPPSTFIPPDWIYQTRLAGPVGTWSSTLIPSTTAGGLNSSYVVGRYAYVVYDEGGLLDVNAAGYPSSVTSAMVRHKISEAWRGPDPGGAEQQATSIRSSPGAIQSMAPPVRLIRTTSIRPRPTRF